MRDRCSFSWTEDAGRCAAAGLPEDIEFATKPQLARKMVERAVAAGLPFGWFTADEVYGVAWYRHVTLAMCAQAWLAVTAASRPPPEEMPGGGPGDGGRAREGAGRLWTTFWPVPATQ